MDEKQTKARDVTMHRQKTEILSEGYLILELNKISDRYLTASLARISSSVAAGAGQGLSPCTRHW